MGMMKTGKPALQGATSVDSSLPFSSSSLEGTAVPHCGQTKSKLNRFKIITSILKQGDSTASPRPPEASNGLPNGVLPPVPDEGSEEKLDFSTDIADFGSFQKHQQEGGGAGIGAGEVLKQISSLTEEQPSVSGADAPQRDHRVEEDEEDSERLLVKQTEENSTFNEARRENNELLNTVGNSDDSRKEEREGKSTETFTSSDSVAGGILSEETIDTEI